MALPGAMATLLVLATSVGAVEWQDCSVEPDDRWVPAGANSLPARLHYEHQRRYTCVHERGAWAAASFTFESKCTARAFTIPEIQSCLKDRRVLFLGDSLAVQQGDSMLGMLGWNAGFLKLGDPRNGKWTRLPDGTRVPALYECWRTPVHQAPGCSRCYDVFGRDFPPGGEGNAQGAVEKARKPHWGRGAGGHRRTTTATPGVDAHVGVDSTAPEGQEEEKEITEGGIVDGMKEEDGMAREGQVEEEIPEGALGEAGGEEEEEETSVHVRMYNKPDGDGWLPKVMADFNETRASDIFVVNFGAHFPETPEGDKSFKEETSHVLDHMATLGETATVMWREISPTHFPGKNGSYESFQNLPPRCDNNCCDGTPPPLLERNVWVANYLEDKGLADRVKLLQIYRMSALRGSAHRSCHVAPPTTPESEPLVERRLGCTSSKTRVLDCRHWSETGVVEEWNKLMLNHICPA